MRIAVSGAQATGKSTLIGLLCRFDDPSRGEVCIDGGCELSCQSGLTELDGSCVNLANDLARVAADVEAREVIEGLAAGTVDIVVGTHRLDPAREPRPHRPRRSRGRASRARPSTRPPASPRAPLRRPGGCRPGQQPHVLLDHPGDHRRRALAVKLRPLGRCWLRLGRLPVAISSRLRARSGAPTFPHRDNHEAFHLEVRVNPYESKQPKFAFGR